MNEPGNHESKITETPEANYPYAKTLLRFKTATRSLQNSMGFHPDGLTSYEERLFAEEQFSGLVADELLERNSDRHLPHEMEKALTFHREQQLHNLHRSPIDYTLVGKVSIAAKDAREFLFGWLDQQGQTAAFEKNLQEVMTDEEHTPGEAVNRHPLIDPALYQSLRDAYLAPQTVHDITPEQSAELPRTYSAQYWNNEGPMAVKRGLFRKEVQPPPEALLRIRLGQFASGIADATGANGLFDLTPAERPFFYDLLANRIAHKVLRTSNSMPQNLRLSSDDIKLVQKAYPSGWHPDNKLPLEIQEHQRALDNAANVLLSIIEPHHELQVANKTSSDVAKTHENFFRNAKNVISSKGRAVHAQDHSPLKSLATMRQTRNPRYFEGPRNEIAQKRAAIMGKAA